MDQAPILPGHYGLGCTWYSSRLRIAYRLMDSLGNVPHRAELTGGKFTLDRRDLWRVKNPARDSMVVTYYVPAGCARAMKYIRHGNRRSYPTSWQGDQSDHVLWDPWPIRCGWEILCQPPPAPCQESQPAYRTYREDLVWWEDIRERRKIIKLSLP